MHQLWKVYTEIHAKQWLCRNYIYGVTGRGEAGERQGGGREEAWEGQERAGERQGIGRGERAAEKQEKRGREALYKQ